jgi:pimeloyl-ACP methyl ester carboxylesterase
MLLNHIQQGQGQPVVLLHGFCENLRIWDKFMEPLAEHAQVIALDLPGFGENPPLEPSVTIEEMADQVYQTLHELGIVSGVLVGHSLGGYVSLAFAEKYPQWMRGMCLFHSTAYADSEEKKEKRDKAVRFIEDNGIEAFNNGLVPSLFAASQRNSMWDTIEEVKAIANQTSAQSAIVVTKAMKNRPDRTAVLQQATYPIMFIAGREDEAVPLEDVQKQCWLPTGPVSVHVLPQVSHMGMYEAPEFTEYALKSFIGSI